MHAVDITEAFSEQYIVNNLQMRWSGLYFTFLIKSFLKSNFDLEILQKGEERELGALSPPQ